MSARVPLNPNQLTAMRKTKVTVGGRIVAHIHSRTDGINILVAPQWVRDAVPSDLSARLREGLVTRVPTAELAERFARYVEHLPCPRCGGPGYRPELPGWAKYDGGVCFRCHGSGLLVRHGPRTTQETTTNAP